MLFEGPLETDDGYMTEWALRVRVRAGTRGLAAGLRLAPALVQAPGVRGRTWMRAGVSLLLLAPLIAAIAAGILQRAFGFDGPQNVLTSFEGGGVRTAALHIWVFLGPALALVLNALWMTRLRVARPAGGIAADLTVRLGVVSAVVLAAVLFLAAAFYGHLVADAIACSNGIRSAC
jgi:hypothetical protein